ncbi:MAG: rbsK [Acidobacteria bacterium]|nr:rbsK [Acidobacteriota bacterium]
MDRPRIVSIGGATIDLLVQLADLPAAGQCKVADAFYEGVGGKGANQAVAAARLGADAALVAAIGDDERGLRILTRLAAENVDTAHVLRIAETPTGGVVIQRDRRRHKQVAVLPGANGRLGAAEIEAAAKVIRGAAVVTLQLEIPMEAVLRAAELAGDAGVLLILDPSPARQLPGELLRRAAVLKPNAHEAQVLTGIEVTGRSSAHLAARHLLERGVGLVAIEAGEEGNLFLSRSEEVFVPLFDIEALDATGAGDAMTGALAVALAEGMPLQQAARFAAAAAALSTRRHGAQDAMPSREEVERLLG